MRPVPRPARVRVARNLAERIQERSHASWTGSATIASLTHALGEIMGSITSPEGVEQAVGSAGAPWCRVLLVLGTLAPGCAGTMQAERETGPALTTSPTALQEACVAGQSAKCDAWVASLHAACERGNHASCSALATAYARGEGPDPDLAKAAALYERACRGGDANGCFNRGQMWANGEGGPVDPVRAVAFLDDACNRGELRACANLGNAYAQGRGVPRDPARAAGIFLDACRRGAFVACNNLGLLQVERQEWTPALDSFRRSCQGGWLEGCSNLAVMFYQGNGVPKDASAAREILFEACRNGHDRSCEMLGLQ